MEEVWKDVNGYEGLYQVSNLGRVKSLQYGKERILTPIKNGKDNMHIYLNVRLYGKRVWYIGIHHLVALAFLNKKSNNLEVNHKNGITFDNWVGNLEWVTHKQNIQHSFDVLKRKSMKNIGHKLTLDDVKEIRKKYIPRKYSLYRLAKEYGVTPSLISLIINKKIYV